MDSKEITDILRTQGLDVAEDLAVQSVKGALKLIRAMLPKVNPTMAMVLDPLLVALEPILLDMIDKIDGEDDPDY